MDNETLYGTTRETITATRIEASFGIRGCTTTPVATRILAGTEVRIVPATRSTYFIEEYGMGRFVEVTLAELHAMVEPA